MITKKRAALMAIATAITYVALWFSGMLSPYYFAAIAQGPMAGDGFRLLSPEIAVEIDAQPIAGLSQNLSGLTYSSATASLFAVVNKPPIIAELSLDGQLLRLIPVTGLQDPEGITHLDGTKFLVADEGDQSLHLVTIDAATTEIVIKDPPVLVLGFDFQHNMGFEGASWDATHKRLYLSQEMLPLRVLTVDGLDPLGDHPHAIAVKSWDLAWQHRLKLIDVSSLSIHDASGHLLLLSHQSGMALEYDRDARLVGAVSLTKGNLGLKSGIAQAEGLAVGPEGQIFIVAEPNLFFRFSGVGK